jgi:L-threonylcarbamoyladenylate synthase
MFRRLVVSIEQPDLVLLAEAADLIRAGGLVAIPTDTLYGLAADPFQPSAVAKIFDAKERPTDRGIALIAADAAQVVDRVSPLTAAARRLAETFWPGPLTLLVESPASLASDVSRSGKVGVRVPAHPVARQLCAACGIPLTATSANISGQPALSDPDLVARALGDRIDVLVDAGPTTGGPPSTIVDATGSMPILIRSGAIAWDEILRVWPG